MAGAWVAGHSVSTARKPRDSADAHSVLCPLSAQFGPQVLGWCFSHFSLSFLTLVSLIWKLPQTNPKVCPVGDFILSS